MTAVAVWDHRPTPDELLDARLTRGWTPVATVLVDGDVILGHAACQFSSPREVAVSSLIRFPEENDGMTDDQ